MAVPIRVGQTWRRRVELFDGFDWLVITGKMQVTEDRHEWALRPVDGIEVVAATAQSLKSAFTLVSEPDARTPDMTLSHWCDGE